ncbi:MAG: WD40 repeat domain-containing protein [Candidatus Babeliales bacterium]|jgi:WD40 repeat protein
MKYVFHLCAFVVTIANSALLTASSITAYDNQTAYETNNHVFHNNEVAQGFVRLNEGFTVMPDACVSMDLLFSVSGDLDLRETGTVRMLKDLEFDSGVTLTTGGYIDGRGHTLILHGDFVIPAGNVVHINGDTIIDAQGCQIIVGENAQIFVDTNITLTIANAVVTSMRNAPTYPPLRCAALSSKLVFDNVVFAPADDFLLQQGQLFIHNDVMVTGTSAFVYHSPMPSFIVNNSCLYFDPDVTFSVAPATFTDAPYTLNNTYTDNNFFKMTDVTSVLYLNGCDMQTTHTGFRLARGTVIADSKLTCVSDTTLTYKNLAERLSDKSGLHAFSWHPNGWLFATGHNSEVRVYRFDVVAATLYDTQLYGDGDSVVKSVQWSPDGKFLAVGGIGGDNKHNIKVYYFDGTRLVLWAEADFDIIVSEVRWSPDGRYLAVGGYQPISLCYVRVFRFNGTSLPLVAQFDENSESLDWSPDGKYLVIGNASAPARAEVLRFDGASLTVAAYIDYGNIIYAVRWSPDGRYLAVGGYRPTDNYEIHVYRFDGSSLTFCTHTSWGRDTLVHSLSWNPDGRYLITCGSRLGINLIRTYNFDGTMLSLIDAANLAGVGESVYPISWRPDGNFIAVLKDVDPTTYFFNVNYGNETLPQALSSSIVFGDHAKGGDYDIHINLQPGASLNLDGKMVYDNVDAISIPLPG